MSCVQMKMSFSPVVLLVIAAASAAAQSSDQTLYQGAQVLKLKLKTDAQKTLIGKLQSDGKIEIWKRFSDGMVVDVLVISSALAAVKAQLKKANVEVQVMIADVAKTIKTVNPPTDVKRKQTPMKKGANIKIAEIYNLPFTQYNRLSVIYGYLDFLARTYPTFCTVQSIGTTVLGTEIKMLKISGSVQPANLSIVIDGGIHAREWISPAAVTYVIRELVENRTLYAFAPKLDYYIIPVANPDGYEYTHTTSRFWRKNRRDPTSSCPGVDLNRNFDYMWGGLGASSALCSEIYRGKSAFSEPESRAMRDVMTTIGTSAKAYIAFHSYGQQIIYPWSYKALLTNDSADLDKMGKKMAAAITSAGGPAYTVGNSAVVVYVASGVSDDFARGGANIKYSFTIELRDKGTSGFLLPATQIVPTGKDAFAAVQAMSLELIAGA
ncbi:carboxypeptidase B-like [Cloeon dipterum]|uniref:carboxypeptidase B-like n=1 Tax=Cloeon dipterum TaxID=197152 RepID=UPI00321F910E